MQILGLFSQLQTLNSPVAQDKEYFLSQRLPFLGPVPVPLPQTTSVLTSINTASLLPGLAVCVRTWNHMVSWDLFFAFTHQNISNFPLHSCTMLCFICFFLLPLVASSLRVVLRCKHQRCSRLLPPPEAGGPAVTSHAHSLPARSSHIVITLFPGPLL